MSTQTELFQDQPKNIGTRSFIEVQFPVSKLSKECYKERDAKDSQTLTGVGRWWGRKPLILVRAAILGLLFPSTNDPRRDREIFLKLLTMDDDGLQRRRKAIPLKVAFERLTPAERAKYFRSDAGASGRVTWKAGMRCCSDEVQSIAFSRMSYDEKLKYAVRPEEIEGPAPEAWDEINKHLSTTAASLPELVRELGLRRFGRVPRVGDAFCGGGSIPFEAARLGCDSYGSDLNPVAALLTWGALNIVGGGHEVAEQIQKAQERVYDSVDRDICRWGIEHQTEAVTQHEWDGLMLRLAEPDFETSEIQKFAPRADAYLYCIEVRCPQTGWMVPLAPNWVVGLRPKTIAKLVPDYARKRYNIEIVMGVTDVALVEAKAAGTIKDGYVVHPILREQDKPAVTLAQIRGDRRGPGGEMVPGLRPWENNDVLPREGDVLQERLYCVRWSKQVEKPGPNGELRWEQVRWYAAVTQHDLQREEQTSAFVRDRFEDWQRNGFIPSRTIEPGDKTDEPIRTRGWTRWHHLFNPRQLLVLGALSSKISSEPGREERVACLLGLGRAADYNARLARWHPREAGDKGEQTFSNQALNTLAVYATRSCAYTSDSFKLKLNFSKVQGNCQIQTVDARSLATRCELWVTDPPYADAVNYHELSEFFLSWYAEQTKAEFPEWEAESRRALAIKGSDVSFRQSMVACYRNLAEHMPDDGFQVVMFTHQDAGVWADLAMILWASGLQVSSAWCLATETDSALKEGNHVQGTVLLVLKKLTADEAAFLDELYPEVESEVKNQLDSMLGLDDAEDPNFADTDYQLAAYAAALRVLTKYRRFEGRDVAHELNRVRAKGESSAVEQLIIDAVKVACDYLVPKGFDTFLWKTLRSEERFYLKGLDLETHGEFRQGAYTELARGFGLREYRNLLGSGKANEVRLKTATEFGRKELMTSRETAGSNGPAANESFGFASTLTRNVLFAVAEVTKTGEAQKGKMWLRTELQDYWRDRKAILALLEYLARLGTTLADWTDDSASARVLAGAVENDHA